MRYSQLDQDIKYLPGVGPQRKDLLGKELNIHTWGDLLEYYPYKYIDRSRIYHISELTPNSAFVQIRGRILSFEEYAMGVRKKRIVAHFTDGHGVVDLVWFHGTKYIYDNYKPGVDYIVFGKPVAYNGRLQFTHPDIDKAETLVLSEMGLQPYYITSERMKKRGLNSRSIEKIQKTLIEQLKTPLPETLTTDMVNRLHLMSHDEACRLIHFPKTTNDVRRATMRLKFEELFYVQLNIQRYASDQRRKYRGYVFPHVGNAFNTFYYHHLPFPLTNAQKRVIREIRTDMGSGKQMNRLLQGDVGSGKTLVALMCMLLAIDNGYQACIMAPTEILAEQHMATISFMLEGLDIDIRLLTGSVKGKKREQILNDLAAGDTKILVGTHALIEDTVQFRNLGFVVIDEQHRFGVAQRAKLWHKNTQPPHILVMTATPIPRTLAMTIYGDLDVSVIDEMPPGRKPVHTLHQLTNHISSLYSILASFCTSMLG